MIKKIGMVVAMEKEVTPFLEKAGEILKTEKVSGFDVKIFNIRGKEVYLIKSGIGEIYASGATQVLISYYGVEAVFNFGVCGSLVDEIGVEDTVFVNGVVHYDFDLSPIDPVLVGQYPNYDSPVIKVENNLIALATKTFPNVKTAICASADKFVADEKIKQNLNATFGASVCDMECAGVLLTCLNANIPTVIIKAVSDGKGGAEEFNRRVNTSAKVYIELVNELVGVI
jgi:adenosylhomocysteine nucleosidase